MLIVDDSDINHKDLNHLQSKERYIQGRNLPEDPFAPSLVPRDEGELDVASG